MFPDPTMKGAMRNSRRMLEKAIDSTVCYKTFCAIPISTRKDKRGLLLLD